MYVPSDGPGSYVSGGLTQPRASKDILLAMARSRPEVLKGMASFLGMLLFLFGE